MRIHGFISRDKKAYTFILWRYEKDLVFPHVWLGGWKSESMEKLFYLVEKKNGMIENVICLNLFSCLYYIIYIYIYIYFKRKKNLMSI